MKIEVSLGLMREEASMKEIAVNRRIATNPRRRREENARMVGESGEKCACCGQELMLEMPQMFVP